MYKNRFIISTIFIFFCAAIYGQKIPLHTGWIVDSAQIIKDETEYALEEKIENLNKKTGQQISVLTIESLEQNADGSTIEEYSSKVFEKWGLGQKDKDNGVLIIVAVKERQVRIETGYGLEEVLTDTKCGLIIRKKIIPHFRENNYSDGINEGVDTIISLISGDENTVKELEETKKTGFADLIPLFMWIVFILIIVLSNIFGRKNHKDDDDHFPPSGPFFGDPCSGGFGGPWRGGNSHGGFGGGFGGGGGGRSGGGGASGRW